MQAGLERAAHIGLHRVSDHHDLFQIDTANFSELGAGPVEHVAVGFAQVISAPAGAGFQKGGGGSGSGTRFLGGNRAPIIGIRRQEPGAAFDALVGLGQPFRRGRAFPHHHVVGTDGVVGDLLLMQGREQAAFPEHEDGAIGMGLREKLGRVQGGRIEVPGCQPADADVFQPHAEIFRRRG